MFTFYAILHIKHSKPFKGLQHRNIMDVIGVKWPSLAFRDFSLTFTSSEICTIIYTYFKTIFFKAFVVTKHWVVVEYEQVKWIAVTS